VDPDSKRLRVSVTDGAGRPVRDGGLARWLASVAPARASGEVGVALVSDARIRALNRRYRRQDQATDVLSFPAADSRAHIRTPRSTMDTPQSAVRDRQSAVRDLQSVVLGDIVIARGAARRQAKEAGHSFQAELRVLALHGLLHLLGYDHHERAGRRMKRLEVQLRRKGGLRSGLIERASGRPQKRRSTRRARA